MEKVSKGEKMDAYELAKELEYYEDDITVVCQAAYMLKKQAKRIEELELQLGIESYLHQKLATS